MTDDRIPDFEPIASPPPRSDIDYDMVKNGDLIGSGGQAIVKRTTLLGPNPPNTVAVKEPQVPSETLDTATIESFFQEAKTWVKLAKRERNSQYRDTDHIVGIVAIGDRLPWVAMEYMDGGSLADRLDSHPEGLPLEETLWITQCLCKGLKLAHDHGIAHLDLKPANVLFRETPGDTWDVPKIADWGLARTLLEESGSMDAFSVEYAAPEQFDADQFGNPDTHTDIYQLGAIVYEMLTGRPPYTGGQVSIMHDVVYSDEPNPPSAHREGVPSTVDEVVMRALSTDKSQRYRGAIELFEQAIQESRNAETNPEHRHTKAIRESRNAETTPEHRHTIWSMFQTDPARTGSPSHATGPTGAVAKSWTFETNGWIESSPAVVDGTVYVGSTDHNLYALDASTGDKQWAFQTGASVNSSPAVVEGTVYVGSNDNNLYALDASTGKKQWAFQTGDRIKPSPAVVEGTVYVGSTDHNLYALDASTGKKQWTFETGASVNSSPAVVDGTVYVGSDDNNLYALDASTGDKQFAFETGGSVNSSPAVVDGTVYVGSNDKQLEVELDTLTGDKQLEVPLDTLTGDKQLYALDASTGEKRWGFETGLWISVASSPAVVDGTVYVGSNDSNLYALDASTGKKQWTFETGASVNSSPAVVDGTVYVGSNDHNLYALDASTGKKQWAFQTGDRVKSSPAVVDGTVYVGSGDTNLYAIE